MGNGAAWNLSVNYSCDGDRLLGTGGALREALPLLGDAFFVIYGDSSVSCKLGEIEQAFLHAKAPALVTVYRNDGRWDRSNVVLQAGRLVRYDKRNLSLDMTHIDYGVSILTSGIFAARQNGEAFDLSEVLTPLSL